MTKTVPTADLVPAFRQRITFVLKDLRDNAPKHPELMLHIGSLAREFINRGGKKSWGEVKAALSNEAYDGVLKQCEEQGNKFAQAGDLKSAHAVEIIATSVIASRINDKQIATGNQLLDDFIGQAIRVYDAAPKKAEIKTATLN